MPTTTDPSAVPLSPIDASTHGLPESVGTLEYATGTSLSPLAPALGWSLALAVLSGLCVGTCWLIIGFEHERTAYVVLHEFVYAATLFVAVMAGVRLNAAAADFPRLRSPARVGMDVVAGVGLLGLAAAPLYVFGLKASDETLALCLGLTFALLLVTGYRHRLLYTALAHCLRDGGRRRTAGLLSTVGWIKTWYESLWLGCCTLGLLLAAAGAGGRHTTEAAEVTLIALAVGAAGGCIGFIGVWVMMLIAHSIAYAQSR